MRKLFTIFIIVTLGSCNNLKSHDAEEQQTRDTTANSDNFDNATKTCLRPFGLSDDFIILGFNEVVDNQSSSTDATICNTWTLTSIEIAKIIKDAQIISGPDWHHLFDHLPCSISGQLGQRGNTFNFEINAGSWATITCGDSTIRLGNFKNDNEHLFLSTAIKTETVQ